MNLFFKVRFNLKKICSCSTDIKLDILGFEPTIYFELFSFNQLF